jgi:hypothetical protein
MTDQLGLKALGASLVLVLAVVVLLAVLFVVMR